MITNTCTGNTLVLSTTTECLEQPLRWALVYAHKGETIMTAALGSRECPRSALPVRALNGEIAA